MRMALSAIPHPAEAKSLSKPQNVFSIALTGLESENTRVQVCECEKARSVAATMCHARNVFFVFENPIRSSFFEFATIKQSLHNVNATRHVTPMAAFGFPSLKPLELWTTFPLGLMQKHVAKTLSQGWRTLDLTSMVIRGFKNPLYKLVEKCVPKGRGRPSKKKKAPLVNFTARKVKDLKQSSAYEPRFCQAVSNLFVEARG